MSVFDRVPFPFRLNLKKSDPQEEPSANRAEHARNLLGGVEAKNLAVTASNSGAEHARNLLGGFEAKNLAVPAAPTIGAERTHADQHGNFVPADHPDARPVAARPASLSERALQTQRREASLGGPRPPASVAPADAEPSLRDLGEIHDHIMTSGGDVSPHEGVGISQEDKDRWTAQFNMHLGKTNSNGGSVHTEDDIYDMTPEEFSGVRSLASIHGDFLSGQVKNISPEEKARWVAQRKIIHDDLYSGAAPTRATLADIHNLSADEFGRFQPSDPDDDDGDEEEVDVDDGRPPVDPDRPPVNGVDAVDPDRPPVGDDDGADDDDDDVADDDDPHGDFRSALINESPYRFIDHLYPEFKQVRDSLGTRPIYDHGRLEQTIQSNKTDIVKALNDDALSDDVQDKKYGLDPEDVQDIDSLAKIAPTSIEANAAYVQWRSTVSSLGASESGDYQHIDDEQSQAMKDTYPGVYFSDLAHQDVNYRWPAASSMENNQRSGMGMLCAMGIADTFFGTRTAREMTQEDDEKLHQMQEILQGGDEDAIASVNMDEFFILLNSHAIEHKIDANISGLVDENGDTKSDRAFMPPAYQDPAYYETEPDLGYEYAGYDNDGLDYKEEVLNNPNWLNVLSGVTNNETIDPRHDHIHNIIRHDVAVDDTPAASPQQQAAKSQQNRELISLNRQAINEEFLANPQRYADSFGNVFGKDEIAVLSGLIDRDETTFREGGSRDPRTSEAEVASRAKALLTTGFVAPYMSDQEIRGSKGFDHFSSESEQLKRDYPGVFYGPKSSQALTDAESGTTPAALANHRWPPASKMTDKEKMVFMRLCAMGTADQYLGTRTARVMSEEDNQRLLAMTKKVEEGRPVNMDEFFILLNSHARTHRIDAARHGLFNAASLNRELAPNPTQRGSFAPRGGYDDPSPFTKIPSDMDPDEEDISDDSTGWRSMPPKPHRRYRRTEQGNLYRTKMPKGKYSYNPDGLMGEDRLRPIPGMPGMRTAD